MKKIIAIVIILVLGSCYLYFGVPVTKTTTVDYVLKNQNDSTYFSSSKTDYEIKVNRNLFDDDRVNIVLNFNDKLYYLKNSLENNIAIKYSDNPYSIDNHYIDTNSNSIITMTGFLSKDLEKMILHVEYNEEKFTLYIPAVDKNDINDIQKQIFVDQDFD